MKQLCKTLKVCVWPYRSALFRNGLCCAATSQVFKDATLFFSRSTPNLATVIPAMDHIDEALTTQSHDPTFEISIRTALGIAKRTLNHYYDRTDYSEVYRIAMSSFFIFFPSTTDPSPAVLHPRHKLKYFQNAGWPTDWIKTAQEILCTEFNRSYVNRSEPTEREDSETHPPPVKRRKVRGDRCVNAFF